MTNRLHSSANDGLWITNSDASPQTTSANENLSTHYGIRNESEPNLMISETAGNNTALHGDLVRKETLHVTPIGSDQASERHLSADHTTTEELSSSLSYQQGLSFHLNKIYNDTQVSRNVTESRGVMATTSAPHSKDTVSFLNQNVTFGFTEKKHHDLADSTTMDLTADILKTESNSSRDTWSIVDVSKVSFTDDLRESIFIEYNNTSLCDWNLTLCYNATDITTESPHNESSSSDHDLKYWVLFLSIFPLFTIFGNLLICLSVYRERQLRTVTNYFIVSLAVADIMVAALVMPLAVYVEVNSGVWNLGNALCDTWVAFDVMCCTASILNLTAISVDRFIAVTRPIQYATYKNSNRVWVMLAGVWLVSVGISSPIALGMNYTERRSPEWCTFYNSDFLIYSSMGSFWIPCVVMIILYYRIFKAIRDRALRSKNRAKANDMNHYRNANVIENKAHATRSSSEASNTEENANTKKELATMTNTYSTHLTVTNAPQVASETSFTNYNAKLSGTDTDTANCNCPRECKSPTSEDTDNVISDHVISNRKLLSPTSEEENDKSDMEKPNGASDYTPPTCVQVEQTCEQVISPTSYSNKALLSPPPPRRNLALFTEHKPNKKNKQTNSEHHNGSPRKYVTKFNFNLRHNSRKKKDRSSSSKKERKATRTLAIVLGMFLFCWVPFFTINIMNAICIKYKLFDRPECNLDPLLFSFFVWLGYINSFMNPVIYTIFNNEFRKAFKKLLLHPC